MALQEKSIKSEKFDIRLTVEEQALIKGAAKLRRTTPTSFIRDQAVTAAENVMHEQTHFSLTKEQWQILDAAFKSPARVLPNLRKILAQPDEWDAGTLELFIRG